MAARIAFDVVAADIDESIGPGEAPVDHVQRLAVEKAEAVSRTHQDAIVLGADTVVVVEGAILGKPRDVAEAKEMLGRLSGTSHAVLTGVALVSRGHRVVTYAETRVWMRGLSMAELDDYVASGEPMDKAGAYAIQGMASRFVERIDGSYSNVVGLPVSLVYGLLKDYPFR